MKTAPAFNIALLGDIHGRILLAFELVARWQEAHGEAITHILSVGDLGVYRGLRNMEKTSRRWAERYPEELGFSKFFFDFDLRTSRIRRHPMADAVLARSSADLYFVPGNHEEHRYLETLWQTVATASDAPLAVDRDWVGLEHGRYGDGDFSGYGRIYCLPQGIEVTLPGPLDEETYESTAGVTLIALDGLEAYTPKPAWTARARWPIDIFLSHETYQGRLADVERASHRDGYGSGALREVLERIGPRVHFFGHHHHFYPEVALSTARGITRSIGLGQLIFDVRDPKLRRAADAKLLPGAMGILRVTAGREGDRTSQFDVVDDVWLRELRLSEVKALL